MLCLCKFYIEIIWPDAKFSYAFLAHILRKIWIDYLGKSVLALLYRLSGDIYYTFCGRLCAGAILFYLLAIFTAACFQHVTRLVN